jgi:hypothetical protein
MTSSHQIINSLNDLIKHVMFVAEKRKNESCDKLPKKKSLPYSLLLVGFDSDLTEIQSIVTILEAFSNLSNRFDQQW